MYLYVYPKPGDANYPTYPVASMTVGTRIACRCFAVPSKLKSAIANGTVTLPDDSSDRNEGNEPVSRRGVYEGMNARRTLALRRDGAGIAIDFGPEVRIVVGTLTL